MTLPPSTEEHTGFFRKLRQRLRRMKIAVSVIAGGKELNFLNINEDGKIYLKSLEDELPAGTQVIGIAKIGDGTETADVEAATSKTVPDLDGKNLLGVHALLSGRSDVNTTVGIESIYDGSFNTNASERYLLGTVASLYARVDNSNTKPCISKTSDGADINNSTTGCLVVINLNYVWDAANTKWVPMTQP